VQPLLALAVGLQRTGRHKVRFAAPDNFQPLVSEYGLDYFPLGINTQDLLGRTSGLESGRNILLWSLQALRELQPTLALVMERTWLSCQDADSIIYSYMGFGAYHVAEKLGVPCYLGTVVPGLDATGAYPNPGGGFPLLPFGETYNRLTYSLSRSFLQLVTGSYLNRWRKDTLDLPPIPIGSYPYGEIYGRPVPVLGGFSSRVLPKPADWEENIHITGYWFLDPPANWEPPSSLVEFLESGQPPVYIGFGSMANRSPQQTGQLVSEALERAGQRGVLVGGWGRIDETNLPSYIFPSKDVPHSWLFPRVSAVVHHGGSGTTGAGLRAGVPSVIVPHMGDQPFWAQRVIELGVGPQPIPRRQLTAIKLANAISKAVKDTHIQARARSLGETIRKEEGIKRTIEIIEGKDIER
jgi:UDP:flavonoid glycosyltransferase YjiC (YdhE family)